MARWLWLLFFFLTASSLLAMTTVHACDTTTVELGVVCLTDCDRSDSGDADQPLSHHHGCQGQNAFVSNAAPVRSTVVAMVNPADQVSPQLLPRDVEPALRPPTA